MVALIPARARSKRCPGKNTRLLGGKPLIAYTIGAAQESGVFTYVVVSSEDPEARRLARSVRGVDVVDRPHVLASDAAADIGWVRHAVDCLGNIEAWNRCDSFAILRPTSPFRTAATIRRAYDLFTSVECDSIRAVQPVQQHPGKMWWSNGETVPMTPVCDAHRSDGVPWHSCPTQTLPPCYVQNASLEMAWTRVLNEDPSTISGRRVVPFVTRGYEGFDINTEEDFARAEALLQVGAAWSS